MQKPNFELLPGDALACGPTPWAENKLWCVVGNLISWGQWQASPSESNEQGHIALKCGPGKFAEQNPGGFKIRPDSEIPWERVLHIYRPTLDNGMPFAMLPGFPEAVENICFDRQGEGYAYSQIVSFLGAGLVARAGLPRAASWMRKKYTQAGTHKETCGAMEAAIVEAAYKRATGLDLDLFPAHAQFPDRGEPTPADFNDQISPFLVKLA